MNARNLKNRALGLTWKRRTPPDAIEALQEHAARRYGADGEPTDPGHIYNILLRYRTRLALRNPPEATRLANFLQSVATNGDVGARRAASFEKIAEEIADAFELRSEIDGEGDDGFPVYLFEGRSYRAYEKGDTAAPASGADASDEAEADAPPEKREKGKTVWSFKGDGQH